MPFYRSGLRVTLERGRITIVEEQRVPPWSEVQAAFPALVFLQLLFGYRGLDALCDAYPDVWIADDALAGAVPYAALVGAVSRLAGGVRVM